jgi:hypothetical protein
MIAVYDKVREDVKYRKEWANKHPVGFTLPNRGAVVAPHAPQKKGPAQVEQALAA